MGEEHWGKTAGLSAAGFFVGGPLGAIVGCGVGYALDKLHDAWDAKKAMKGKCVICGKQTYAGATYCEMHLSMMYAGKHHGH